MIPVTMAKETAVTKPQKPRKNEEFIFASVALVSESHWYKIRCSVLCGIAVV